MLSKLPVRQKHLSLISNNAQQFDGSSRRAISYFPGSGLSPKSKLKLSLNNEQPILPQLLKIEAAKLSGCVKMESSRYKSRSAALLYRGRVIACVYGSKANPEQIFGMQAYSAMMSEISSVNSKVVSYALDDKVVLSAASMFHGQVFNASAGKDAKVSLKSCLQFIEDNVAPGSVAVADQSGKPVCFLYLSGGSLLGINSLNSSVNEKDIRSVLQYLNKSPQSRIMSNSFAPEQDFESALTFSMLGQSNHSSASVCSDTELAALRNSAKLAGTYSLRPIEAPQEVRLDRFINQRDLAAKQAKLSHYAGSSYGVKGV